MNRLIIIFKICVGAICGALSVQSLASQISIPPVIDVNYKPDPKTDEGGLWYQVEKIEKEVQISPYRVTDAELNEYVNNLVCKLTPDYCSLIRVYIIDNPHFNATIYPNGMMHLWTGVFLRLENEAQLAAVIGHEIGHFLQTHQIEQFRKYKNSRNSALLLDIAIGGLTGIVGLGGLISGGALAGFGRDQEREADIIGLELMGYAGYETDQASLLWKTIINERNADKSTQERSVFWATHPSSEERLETLANRSAAFKEQWNKPQTKGLPTFEAEVGKIYLRTMEGHINLQEYEQTEEILKRHQNLNYDKSLISYFYGELYRLRGNAGDQILSMQSYEKSINSKSCPNNAFKQLGYLYLKQKNNARAGEYFQLYLEKNPDAQDKAMINYYMELLNK